MGKRILLVDDEPLILKGLKYTLEQEGYETDSAMDGEEALAMFESGHFDLILLDVMLPKLDGISVCQRIRERSDIPIIMLTAKGEDMDKILGLEYGADDYITKPFNILEVKARMKAILRRSARQQKRDAEEKPASEVLSAGELRLDIESRRVLMGDREINLTAREYDLLELFIRNPGHVYSREELLKLVWGNRAAAGGDVRTVDVHVRRLREKVEPSPSEPKYIHTKWGVGYYFRYRQG